MRANDCCMSDVPDWVYDAFSSDTHSLNPSTDFYEAALIFVDENGSETQFSGWVYEVPTDAGIERSKVLYHDEQSNGTSSTMRFITDNEDIFGSSNSSNAYKNAPVAESKQVFDEYHTEPGYYIASSTENVEKSISEVQDFYQK
jgi:hypothetical protein